MEPTRLRCPWDSAGKNIGVGCHALLQGIFPTQKSNPHLLCLLHWKVGTLPLEPPGSPIRYWWTCKNHYSPCYLNNSFPFGFDENIHCWPRLSPNDYCKFHQKTLKNEQKDAVTTAVGSHPLDEHWQGQGTTGLNGTGDSPWPMAFILVVCTYFYKETTLIYACLISFNFHIDEKLPTTEWKKH